MKDALSYLICFFLSCIPPALLLGYEEGPPTPFAQWILFTLGGFSLGSYALAAYYSKAAGFWELGEKRITLYLLHALKFATLNGAVIYFIFWLLGWTKLVSFDGDWYLMLTEMYVAFIFIALMTAFLHYFYLMKIRK